MPAGSAKEKEGNCMWFVFALLSAVFAALTSILAKIGIDGVNSNLATALRTCVVLVMSWGMVFLTDAQKWHRLHQPKELDLPDPLGPRHRRFLAVLLPGASDRRRLQGGTHRQAQCGHHAGPVFRLPPREIHTQIHHRCRSDHCRYPGDGAVRSYDGSRKTHCRGGILYPLL